MTVSNLKSITIGSVGYEKILPLALMSLNYSFELPNGMSLRGDQRSINERLGNINPGDADRDGAKNAEQDKGQFKSTPQLLHLGESVYLCSGSLSGFAALLPNGYNTCLARIPLADHFYMETVNHKENMDKFQVDCGGQNVREMHFSLRDCHGNLVPLGEHEWTAQLCFGYLSLIHI